MCNAIADLWLDVRHALRRLATRLGQTVLMILTLALGIGANTAVFSIVDETILRPAPFAFGSRLVDVMDWDRALNSGGNNLTPEKIAEWQTRATVFERFEAYGPQTLDLVADGGAERLNGITISTGLLDMLGVTPQLGRAFSPDDGRPGSERVVLITDGLWRTRFGRDRGVVGRVVTINDEPHRIVG